MSIFENASYTSHEQVAFFKDKATGLQAIIAIHNTNLGPALGGCRMWAYDNEEEAITDVLRLSRGMSYKAALADLALGGGKSVIIGNARIDKTPELFQAMGRAVERMAGRYIVAEDVGTSVLDMAEVHKYTDHVVGLPLQADQDPASVNGDPSPVTAYGTFLGLKMAAQHRLGKQDLNGVHVMVQGLGHVGMHLLQHLHDAGAKLTITDINDETLALAKDKFGATVVDPYKIYDVDADIYAPCALGATLNDQTLPRLNVSVIAGAANNQLDRDIHGEMLKERNILYTPDFVLNAGGLIKVYYEMMNRKQSDVVYTTDDVIKHLDIIPKNLQKIFMIAEAQNLTTQDAAETLAEDIFKAKAKQKS